MGIKHMCRLGAPRLVEKGIPESAFDLVREPPQCQPLI